MVLKEDGSIILMIYLKIISLNSPKSHEKVFYCFKFYDPSADLLLRNSTKDLILKQDNKKFLDISKNGKMNMTLVS